MVEFCMSKNIIIFIFFSLISINCLANQPFKVVLGLSKPPYVIEKNHLGFELELIQQILTMMGKAPEFIFIPYGRSEKMLAFSDIDAVMTANKHIFPNIDTLSKNYIDYQNVAISLKENAVSLNSIADISNYSIASFQIAHKILGVEFAEAVTDSPLFIQVADQEKQLKLLFLGRVEIVVMDLKIFLYYLNKLNINERESDIKVHHIFPTSSYSMAFKNAGNVSAFNQAMKKYKMTANYQKLIEKYNF
jgi:polar amino acid transport system substrate-binding protein